MLKLQGTWVAWAIGIVSAIFWLQPVSIASATGGLSIGPFLQEVTLAPGQPETSFLITVTNTTKTELPLRLSVVDFGSADEAGGINFLPTTDELQHKYGLASWMRLEKDTLVLAPSMSQRVKVTVENRESLSPGGHYGAVVFQVDTPESKGDGQPKVSFTKAASTLVLAKKAGGERESVSLNGFSWSGPPFSLPEEIKVRFLNNGNVHMTPIGGVMVTDQFNQVITKGTINPESTVILPESLRTYAVKLIAGKIVWLPGWFTVSIQYKNNETGKFTMQKSSFFLATPHSLVLISALVFIGFMIIRHRHRLAAHGQKVARHGHRLAKKATKKVMRRRHKN